MLVLDAERTRACLDPDRLAEALTTALVSVARGTASAPPRVAAEAPAGLLGVMPAHVPGLGLAAKLVSVFADPAHPGRSTHWGVVVLFDEQDGRPLAVMDAEAVTAVRTAATATLALRALGPAEPRRIAVIGTGVQAGAQLDLLARYFADTPVVVGGRDPARAGALAARHPRAAAAGVEEAVRGADAVLCCTGARTPVLHRTWLADGAHVGSVGGSHGPELDPATVRDGSLFVEWPGAVTAPLPAGAHELQGLPPGRATTLGAVLDGAHPGRRASGELTVFKSTGHAALDVAAASVVYRAALEGEGAVLS
ncbi:ornithine cyclodeaminase family protein [uncultured Streptomyces sp.]|uniref:ornithine cyclodeaminase family protein n=1 Tax=uncultured Streptomyces sp. TaxID=174707 RepID=UPI00262C5168|nr:NAD(P)-binding domain-containing protein [uncultured Streptomyces sp.]